MVLKVFKPLKFYCIFKKKVQSSFSFWKEAGALSEVICGALTLLHLERPKLYANNFGLSECTRVKAKDNLAALILS